MRTNSYLLIIVFILMGNNLFSQIGIKTTAPKATLDIVADNPASPNSNEGLLVPRVSAFPTTNPSVDQDGMLVYLTATVGTNSPGFYYWSHITTSWAKLADANQGSDADFY